MRANAIFPRYGYDTILRKLDNAGRLASLEDRLIAYFQNVCGIKTIKAENNVLDMGVDSIALVRLQNTLNLSLNLEISPSVLFENPAPRVMAERLRLSFEAQNPVVVGALKFNAKDKLQIIKDVSDQSATFLSVLSTLQKSLVWIALIWLVYQCYMDMVNRNIRWWSQPKYIFEGPGIEKGFYDRYRDTYHAGFITLYSKTIPLLILFLAIQSVLRLLINAALTLKSIDDSVDASSTDGENQLNRSQKLHFYARCTIYILVGAAFSYAAYGIFSLWLLVVTLTNYWFLQLIRHHPYRRQLIWSFAVSFLLAFNTFCYYYKEEDRSFAKIFGPAFNYLDLYVGPAGLDITTEYYTRYLILRLVSANLDNCQHTGSKQSRFDFASNNFIAYSAFVCYFPLFLRGPSLTYGSFVSQILYQQASESESSFWSGFVSLSGATAVSLSLLKMVVYGIFMEVSMHTFYYPTLIFTEIDNQLTKYEWTGYAIAYLSFMYMQSILSYGVPRLIAAFDNIKAPDDMPRCFFAASTSFHSHWRSYHAGWNKWFLQYIYFPLGGGYHALWLVCIWSFLLHSFDSYWVNWSLITTSALTIERFLKETFGWYKDPNFFTRAVNHALVAWVHFYIFPGATNDGAIVFAKGVFAFMLIFEFSVDSTLLDFFSEKMECFR